MAAEADERELKAFLTHVLLKGCIQSGVFCQRHHLWTWASRCVKSICCLLANFIVVRI